MKDRKHYKKFSDSNVEITDYKDGEDYKVIDFNLLHVKSIITDKRIFLSSEKEGTPNFTVQRIHITVEDGKHYIISLTSNGIDVVKTKKFRTRTIK